MVVFSGSANCVTNILTPIIEKFSGTELAGMIGVKLSILFLKEIVCIIF